MNRRIIYLIAIIAFVPVVIWYAGTFSDLPEGTFQVAAEIADSSSNTMLVPGRLVPDRDVTAGEGGLTFFLQDDAGAIERVVYDGSDPVTPEELTAARENGGIVKVAGHACSDGEGERFHAKSVYIQ